MRGKLPLVASLCATAIAIGSERANATPSSTVWTNSTPDIQPFGMAHLGLDEYLTVGRDLSHGGSVPTDVGLTVGVLPFEKLKLELGVDLVEANDDPLSFNAKLGAPEGALGNGSPALYLGVFGVGTKPGATDYDVACLTVGKSLSRVGRVSAAVYRGNPGLLVDARGRSHATGWMVAIDRGLHAVHDPGGEFNRFVLAADFASGDNALGGGALGVSWYLTPDISLLVGVVRFNEEAINGKTKWTIQLDINQPWFGGR